jgi:hypothetical protein
MTPEEIRQTLLCYIADWIDTRIGRDLILANTSPEIRERLGEAQRRNKSVRQRKCFKLLVLHIGSRKNFADSVSESRCFGDGSIHGDRARVGCSTVGADSVPSPITERVTTGWRRAD